MLILQASGWGFVAAPGLCSESRTAQRARTPAATEQFGSFLLSKVDLAQVRAEREEGASTHRNPESGIQIQGEVSGVSGEYRRRSERLEDQDAWISFELRGSHQLVHTSPPRPRYSNSKVQIQGIDI